MRNTMKHILSAAALLAASVAFADTAEIDGRTWTYYVVGKNAAIISATKKSGEMVIPNAFVTSSGTNVVTSIANDAFADDKMTSVTIPTSVTSIGNGAFAGCKGLRSVTIPQCVCESGLWSVFDAENIVKVVIQDGVTEIGDYAFSGCYNLTSVTLPSSLECIGDYAFESCTALTRVKIPNNVGTLGDGIFQDCFALESVTLPSGITKITSSMFAGCYNLTSVNIPSTVCEIYDYAFEGCYALSTLKIPSGVSAIGDYAFADSGITVLTLPDSIEEVGEGAFSGCLDLATVTITQSILDAGVSTIFDPDLAAAIIIADGVKCIRANAFSGFTHITSVTLPDSVEYIEDRAFYNCRNLKSINLPDEVWRDGYPYEEQIHGIQQIGTEAFCGCESLESIVIPDSAVESCSIGARAFADCYGLKDISVPGICDISDLFYRDDPDSHPRLWENVTIGWGAESIGGFSDCANLKTVVYPKTVYNINSQAFKNCTKLESVTMSDEEDENWTPSATSGSIGEWAFYGCTSLVTVDIPERVTMIENNAFYGCRSLLSVELPERMENYNGLIEGVQYIGDSAFYGCSSLASINLPGGTRTVDGGELYGGVYYIGSMAFAECASLASLEIPDSVTSIGSQAFRNCYGLKDVTLPAFVFDKGLEYVFMNDNPERSRVWESVVIGDGVDCVPSSAFEGLPNLKHVTLPSSMESISDRAFKNCRKLESVTIEGYSQGSGYCDYMIGCEAFYGCASLKYVDFPENLETINNWAFYGCSSLLDVAIPDTVTFIGANAFDGCVGLSSMEIPESVTSVGCQAFRNCYGLKEVTLPKSVFDVGVWEVFRNDKPEQYPCAWETVTVGEGVTNIAASTFSGLTKLTRVTLPGSVTGIGTQAFAGCGKLTDLVCEGNAPTAVAVDAFTGVKSSCTVWVNKGSTGWGTVPGTWQGMKTAYLSSSSTLPALSCSANMVATQVSSGWTVQSASGSALTKKDLASLKVAVTMNDEEVDTIAGYDVTLSDDGKSAVLALKTPEVATAAEVEEEKDEADPSGVLVDVDENLIDAKPTPQAGESVGALPAKTVKGLWYQASWGSDLNALTQGAKVQATGESLYLGVIKQTGNCGFYRISVSEK